MKEKPSELCLQRLASFKYYAGLATIFGILTDTTGIIFA